MSHGRGVAAWDRGDNPMTRIIVNPIAATIPSESFRYHGQGRRCDHLLMSLIVESSLWSEFEKQRFSPDIYQIGGFEPRIAPASGLANHKSAPAPAKRSSKPAVDVWPAAGFVINPAYALRPPYIGREMRTRRIIPVP